MPINIIWLEAISICYGVEDFIQSTWYYSQIGIALDFLTKATVNGSEV